MLTFTSAAGSTAPDGSGGDRRVLFEDVPTAVIVGLQSFYDRSDVDSPTPE